MSRILVVDRNVGASGKGLKPGVEYKVPADVSEQDAKLLTATKRARFLGEEKQEPEPSTATAPENGVETAESRAPASGETAESAAAPKPKRSAKPKKPQPDDE